MSQRLRGLAALPEDASSVPNTLAKHLTNKRNSSSVEQHLLLFFTDIYGHMHMLTHTFTK